ncbi:DUF6266 family protein [Pedobacter steynii]
MGIANSGLFGGHRGKIGDLVFYELNGKTIVRSIGKSQKPPTENQQRAKTDMKIVSATIKTLRPFIELGFSTMIGKTGMNTHNLAVQYNIKNIIKGTYPNQEIACDKLLVSKGELKPAQNCVVTQTIDVLQFSWETNPQMAWPESTDQVMMLAYFPASKKLAYKLYGNNRLLGNDELEIPESLRGEYMETYVSFIAADRKDVADSIYTGSFNA